jgi:pimeloyl-ACP methyl ester carboxylesterase/ketosteroid isomerase-like protein
LPATLGVRHHRRMRRAIAVLVLLFAVSAFAADPAEEVRQAEIAFANAFADRDQAKFFSFVLDDATFMSPGRTLSGKRQVVDRWSGFLKGSQAPFSWGPERVAVNAAGTVGQSAGPVYDAAGNLAGNYSSVWVKQAGGRWKILFDGPGAPGTCLAEEAAPFEQGFVTADDGTKLHYRKIGSGPVTMIVPFGVVMFDPFRQFADLATVITYDMRNRGRSEEAKDPSSWTVPWDVKDLEAVRRHFNVEKFVPVGYSYLGRMVIMYAMDHPDRVARIIQLGPVSMDPDTEYPKELTHGEDDIGAPEADVKRMKELEANAAPPQRELCEARFAVTRYVLVGDPKHASRLTSSCDLENEWPANFRRHLAVNWESSKKIHLNPADVKKVTVPVLTIHGTYDRNAPYGGGREWAMTLPDARLVTIPRGAHQSWSDAPEVVFPAIREFLRGQWPRAAQPVASRQVSPQ